MDEHLREMNLARVTQFIHECTQKFTFSPHNICVADYMKKGFGEIAKNMNPHITESINHTGLPDEFVLTYLEVSEGIVVSSINVFESVFLHFDEEEDNVHVHMDVKFAEEIERHIMEFKLDGSKEGNKDE